MKLTQSLAFLKFIIFFFYFSIAIYLSSKISFFQDQVNYNVIIYIIGVHFLIFLFFLIKKKFVEFLILNFFIFLTLYLIEGILIYVDKDKIIINTTNVVQLRYEAAKEKGVNFDKRKSLEVFFEKTKHYNDLRLDFSWHLKKRDEFTQAQNELNTSLVPLSGPMNKLVMSSNEDGVFKIFTKDKYGFKNNNNRYEKKIENILIGDSFVYSGTYKNEDDISGQLLNKYDLNSLNFGITGTSFLSHYAVIKEYAVKLNPKNIYLFYYEGNDLPELKLEFKNKLLLDYYNNNTQNLILNNQKSARLVDLYQKKRYENLYQKQLNKKNIGKKAYNKINEYSLLSFIKLQKVRKYSGLNNRTLENFDIEQFDDILNKIYSETNKHSINVTFVYLPSWLRYNNYYGYQYKQLSNKKNILNIAEKYFSIIDISVLMRDNPNNYFPFGLYGHLNKAGLILVADTIARKN